MKTTVQQIIGNWDVGYTLDKHTISSTFLGNDANGRPHFDTKRTEVGEAVFLLKYRDDFSQVPGLAREIQTTLCPNFPNIGLVIPMPPSKIRPTQPVTEVAKQLAALIGVSAFEKILLKTPTGKALKDIGSKAEKAEALQGAITLNDQIAGDGRWNALIVDDLYDSGATLEAACAVLRTYPKIGKIYVAALTRKT